MCRLVTAWRDEIALKVEKLIFVRRERALLSISHQFCNAPSCIIQGNRIFTKA